MDNLKALQTTPKTYCFVLMPFSKEFDDIYNFGIKESCESIGAYCERVDEQIFQGTILERIYNQISRADIIIADMSNRNPNVFYEVGYAHALGKPCILITQDSNDIPFDLKHFPHIVYEKSISKLRNELIKRINWYVEHPTKKISDRSIDIEVYYQSQPLTKEQVIIEQFTKRDIIKLTIENGTGKKLDSNSLKVGIIYPSNNNSETPDYYTKLPDGRYLNMLYFNSTLLPEDFAQIDFGVNNLKPNSEQIYFLRIFTENGTRDYPFIVRRNSSTEAIENLKKLIAESKYEKRYEALESLIEIDKTNSTYTYLKEMVYSEEDNIHDSRILELINEFWQTEETRDFLVNIIKQHPNSFIAASALELITKFYFNGETKFLLINQIKNAPSAFYRGKAFCLLAGKCSKFGEIVLIKDFGIGSPVFLDPYDKINSERIAKAMENANINFFDRDKEINDLINFLGWDFREGLVLEK